MWQNGDMSRMRICLGFRGECCMLGATEAHVVVVQERESRPKRGYVKRVCIVMPCVGAVSKGRGTRGGLQWAEELTSDA